MTRISNAMQALLATALVAAPATGFAQNSVSKQAEEVADKAQDLQAATNTLNAKLDAERRAAATDVADRDGDRDGDRRDGHDRDGDDDDGGKLGLLGLLGLAGLLGLRRRDDHAGHDHRNDSRTADMTKSAGSRSGGLDNDTTTRL
ncbi:MAG: hypothetical protein ABIS38_05180 [Sphingomicrobium sp.]